MARSALRMRSSCSAYLLQYSSRSKQDPGVSGPRIPRHGHGDSLTPPFVETPVPRDTGLRRLPGQGVCRHQQTLR